MVWNLVDKISNQHSTLESSISYAQDELVKTIDGKLKIFYEEELNVLLVIFDREHILLINRVLKQPIGHLFLLDQSIEKTILLSWFMYGWII